MTIYVYLCIRMVRGPVETCTLPQCREPANDWEFFTPQTG